MNKGQGQKIAIQFTEDLTGNVSGNESAFSVTGQELLHIGGELVDGDYQIDTVERYPIPKVWEDGLDGEMENVEFEDGKLVLVSIMGEQLGDEDRYDTNVMSGSAYVWAEQRIEAKDDKIIVAVIYRSRGTGNHTLSFRDWNGNEFASAEASGVNAGDWYTFILSNPVHIENGQKYRLYFTRPSATVYRAAVLYDGVTWKSLGWLVSAGEYSETMAIGLIEGVEEYRNNGIYVTEKINIDGDLRIKWNTETPTDTDIKIEVSTDKQNWEEVDNDDVINADGIWIKATLSTADETVTPILNGLWLEEPSALQNIILITMKSLKRFCNVEGKLTVSYDSTKGNLMGAGGAVQSFEEDFMPEDLIQEPIPWEYLTAELSGSIELYELEKLEGFSNEHLTAELEGSIKLWPVNDAPI